MICCICDNEFDQYEETTIGQMTVRNKGGHNPSPVKKKEDVAQNVILK